MAIITTTHLSFPLLLSPYPHHQQQQHYLKPIPTVSFRSSIRVRAQGGVDKLGDFGARDPFPAEVASGFADKVLGNVDTEHKILIPNISALSLSQQQCTPLSPFQSPMSTTDAQKLLKKVLFLTPICLFSCLRHWWWSTKLSIFIWWIGFYLIAFLYLVSAEWSYNFDWFPFFFWYPLAYFNAFDTVDGLQSCHLSCYELGYLIAFLYLGSAKWSYNFDWFPFFFWYPLTYFYALDTDKLQSYHLSYDNGIVC